MTNYKFLNSKVYNYNKDILNWETEWGKYKDIKYFKPIVDYKKQKVLALEMLGNVFK